MDKTAWLIVWAVVFGAIALGVIVYLYRMLSRVVRTAAGGEFEPVVDPTPPAAVETTGLLNAVGIVAVVWGGLHLLGVVAWAFTGFLAARTFSSGLMAGYVAVAGATTCWGGGMLLRSKAYGRRVVSWGLMLLAVMGLLCVVICLLTMADKDAAKALKNKALLVMVLLGVHIVLEIVLGALTQRVGKAEEYTEEPPQIVSDLAEQIRPGS